MSDTAEAGRFRHEALLYSGEPEFVDRVAAFVREGVEAGEPVLVAVGARKIDLLRAALPDVGEDRVRYVDMAVLGRNPALIIPAWRDFADGHRAGTGLRGIGEPIWPGRSADELVESQRHEELLNLAFASGPALWLACPYDTAGLPVPVIEEAMRSHPLVRDGEVERPSGTYEGLDEIARPFDRPLPEPPASVDAVAFGVGDLSAVRSFVERGAVEAGLGPHRALDLVLAASELAANSVRHGGGSGTVRVWRQGDVVICDVRDGGRFERPLAGRARPASGQTSGFGLWLANQVCDLVQIRSFDDGSLVRLHVSARDAA